MSRRGFTLTEIMLALTVMGILGIAMTRIMISDSRFVSRQDAMLATRQAARAAMHAATSEIRMLGYSESSDPLRAISPDSIRVRVPYAFGILCRNTSGSYKAALLPTDSIMYSTAVPRGVYYRDATGAFVRPSSSTPTITTPTTAAATAACVSGSDSVKKLTNGKYVQITPTSLFSGASFGTVFYLYQDISYAFATSTDAGLAGRRALFRRVWAGTSTLSASEELVAPFDTSAKFVCLVGVSLTEEDCPPSGLRSDLSDELRGLELRLVTASDKHPQGETDYETFDLTTRIVFTNRVN